MNVLFRQFLFLIALAVATGPAMAKDESGSTTSKVKKGLFSKKSSSKGSSSSEGKSQYKKIVVNINKASASALSAYLVGIGPAKAQAIVDYRRKNGKFTSAKDLMNVEGIGDATFDGLEKNVSTSRGETRPPKGYKMGEASKKTGSSKKTSARKKSTSSKTTSKSRTSRSDDESSTAKKSSTTKKKSSKSKTSKAKSQSSDSGTKAKKSKKTKAKKESASDKKKKKTKSTKSKKKVVKKKKTKKKEK